MAILVCPAEDSVYGAYIDGDFVKLDAMVRTAQKAYIRDPYIDTYGVFNKPGIFVGCSIRSCGKYETMGDFKLSIERMITELFPNVNLKFDFRCLDLFSCYYSGHP